MNSVSEPISNLTTMVDTQHLQRYWDQGVQLAIHIGGKLLGAIVLWIVGRMLVRGVLSMVDRVVHARHLDATLARYLHSALSVLLNLLLVIALLGVFGIETTTFAGVLAATGVAIGMAWSGLLSNLAAGVFMVILRPFQVGDFVTIGGITGTVQSIGLFATSLDTPDNVRTFLGNAKIFGDTIQNFSANAFRRVDCTAQLAHGSDVEKAIRLLKARIAAIPNVMKDPAPVVEVLESNMAGAVLVVRPFCHTNHYWDVYFATQLSIRDELGKNGYTVPETHVRQIVVPAR